VESTAPERACVCSTAMRAGICRISTSVETKHVMLPRRSGAGVLDTDQSVCCGVNRVFCGCRDAAAFKVEDDCRPLRASVKAAGGEGHTALRANGANGRSRCKPVLGRGMGTQATIPPRTRS
jgi:hypothetical protein